MTLKTDHSFHIGEQHLKVGKPCQDYALSGTLSDDLAYAIVADGCSSGGMTDIGARLVVLATKQALLETIPISKDEPDCDTFNMVNARRDELLEQFRLALGLEYRDLLATSLWMIAESGGVGISVTGDGVAALKYEHDTDIHYYSWDKNIPYYPAYRLAGEDESFKAVHAENATPLTYVEHGLAPIGMGGAAEGRLSTRSVEEGMGGMRIIAGSGEQNTFPGRIQSIGLFSDGVEQIDQIHRSEAVTELMAFKSTNGQFAVRRMNRFLTQAKKQGRGPIDDIAYAVIHLPDPQT